VRGADVLLPNIKAEAVLADKAYDADERVLEPLSRWKRSRHSIKNQPSATTFL
jgi:hypothetical protein